MQKTAYEIRISDWSSGVCSSDLPRLRVGATLLAKASAHPTSSQADPPLSRSSPLPPGFMVNDESMNTQDSMWERACSRRRQHIQHQCKLTHRFRQQASSHRESGQDVRE